jgi:hypothetical protein
MVVLMSRVMVALAAAVLALSVVMLLLLQAVLVERELLIQFQAHQ